MSEEQIDIVNEQNEPTGEVVGRKEAHERKLWHRCANVYFYRVNAVQVEVLVHRRAANKASDPNKWDITFGGHLKAGQGVLEAAISEIQEEVGISMLEEDIKEGEWKIVGSRGHFDKEYFYNFTGNIGDIRLQTEEIQEVKWITLADIESALVEHPEEWVQTSESFKQTAAWLREQVE